MFPVQIFRRTFESRDNSVVPTEGKISKNVKKKKFYPKLFPLVSRLILDSDTPSLLACYSLTLTDSSPPIELRS